MQYNGIISNPVSIFIVIEIYSEMLDMQTICDNQHVSIFIVIEIYSELAAANCHRHRYHVSIFIVIEIYSEGREAYLRWFNDEFQSLL